MSKYFIATFLVSTTILFLIFSLYTNIQTERNDVSIVIEDSEVPPISLSVAIIGDPHLPEGHKNIEEFKKILFEVKKANPDLIVFVGDYIANPRSIKNMVKHRKSIINSLKVVDPVPRAVILGNYESWSNPDDWLTAFKELGVTVLENDNSKLNTKKGIVCIRGLGDFYTKRYLYIDYPIECNKLPKITITHDPAGAFENNVSGFIIAGHTHCGQISLPLFGPIWVPTEAPPSAHCGLYKDDKKTLFVTSGIGTSILPIRFGTQSQWDMLNINYKQNNSQPTFPTPH